MKKTLIIFDIDGTLLYSNKIDSLCFTAAYKTIFGKPFPSIDWRKFPHVTDDTIFKTAFQEQHNRLPEKSEENAFRDHYVGILQEKRKTDPAAFKEVPGSKNTIDQLRLDDQYVIGIGTGGWEKPARVKLKHLHISTQDIYISCADNQPTREGILEKSITDAKAAHDHIERIVYVGDAIWDVKTTRNMQLNFLGIRRAGDYEILELAGAKNIITDYSDYDYFLNQIEKAVPPN